MTGFRDGRPRVSPDGLDGRRPNRGGPTLARNLIAVSLAAAAVTVLLLAQHPVLPLAAPEASTTTTTVASTTTSAGSTTTTMVPISETLRAVLPDVEGTLMVAVGQGSMQLVNWPSSDRKTIVPIPMWAGPEIEFDRSGRFMAFLGPARAGADSALYVGTSTSWNPLTVGVASFRWHARDAGRIAWTGGGLLCSGQVHPDGGFLSLRCWVDIEGRLLAFDDFGYLLGTDSGLIVRLDQDGTEVGRTEGDDAAVGSDGRVLITSLDAENAASIRRFSIADPELTRVTALDWAPEGAAGEYGVVAWSPASSPPELAFLVSLGPERWQLQRWTVDGRLLASPNLAGRYRNIEWDWTGRYLLAPGVGEGGDNVIHIYDTEMRQHVVLGATSWVQDVHLVRDLDGPFRFDPTSVLRSRPVK